jgi:hypothetical protein
MFILMEAAAVRMRGQEKEVKPVRTFKYVSQEDLHVAAGLQPVTGLGA